MGRESTVSPEQVNAIADAMKAEGVKPTSRSVRERLGNTGSMGTINKMLQKWRTAQEHRTEEALVLPPALQRAILEFMDHQLAVARAPLEANLVEQQQEAADLATESERQAETIQAQVEQLSALAAEKAAAEGKAAQLVADLDAARDEAARERQAAEGARTELAKAQLRLEAMPRLEADLAAIRSELADERRAHVDAKQAAAVLTSQKADLVERLAEAKAQADRAGEQLANMESDLAATATDAANERQARGVAEQAAAVLTSQKSDLAGQVAAAKEQVERAGAQLAKLQERDEKLAAELSDARVAVQTGLARIDALTRELEDARNDAARAREQAAQAADQAAELRGKLVAATADRP